MRRQDKLRNMEQANLMLENSYLKRKGLLKEEGDHDVYMEYLNKMYSYKDILEADKYLDQYDYDKGEIKRGIFRTHPLGQKQVYMFLNGIILTLSKILKDFKKESNASDYYNDLEKRAFVIYYDIAKKIGESHAMSDGEAFSKFQSSIERGYKYEL